MSIYRTNHKPVGERWDVSFWKKLYVRCARLFINLRVKYQYHREYKQYLRDLENWQEQWQVAVRVRDSTMPLPPKPLPPPVYLN